MHDTSRGQPGYYSPGYNAKVSPSHDHYLRFSACDSHISCISFIFFLNFRFVNPLMNGDYPDVIKKNAGKKIPSFTKKESLWLKGSLDFVGVNHYASGYIKDQTINLNVDSRDVMADMAVQLICTLVFTLIQFHTLAAICLLRKLLAQSLNQRFSLSFPNYLLVQGEEMVPNNIRFKAD